MSRLCTRPPWGWYCSLPEGHDGPCPTRPYAVHTHPSLAGAKDPVEVPRKPGLWRAVKRLWSAMNQPGTGGLIQPGDWRCRYPDGKVTRWMSHGDAANCRDLWGGDLEWRGDL